MQKTSKYVIGQFRNHCRKVITFIVTAVAALLAGCAAPADPVAMKPTSLAQIETKSAYRSAIHVRSVKGGKNTNPAWVSSISNEDFKAALVSTLKELGYLSNSDNLQLDVKLLAIEQPIAGFSLTVKTVVEYTLRRPNGQVLYQKIIVTPYTAAFGDHLIGVTRLKLANEGSAKANIEAFVKSLGLS